MKNFNHTGWVQGSLLATAIIIIMVVLSIAAALSIGALGNCISPKDNKQILTKKNLDNLAEQLRAYYVRFNEPETITNLTVYDCTLVKRIQSFLFFIEEDMFQDMYTLMLLDSKLLELGINKSKVQSNLKASLKLYCKGKQALAYNFNMVYRNVNCEDVGIKAMYSRRYYYEVLNLVRDSKCLYP